MTLVLPQSDPFLQTFFPTAKNTKTATRCRFDDETNLIAKPRAINAQRTLSGQLGDEDRTKSPNRTAPRPGCKVRPHFGAPDSIFVPRAENAVGQQLNSHDRICASDRSDARVTLSPNQVMTSRDQPLPPQPTKCRLRRRGDRPLSQPGYIPRSCLFQGDTTV